MSRLKRERDICLENCLFKQLFLTLYRRLTFYMNSKIQKL